MLGRVNDRYWRLPTIDLNLDGLDNDVPECSVSIGLVARGIVIDFASIM